MRITLSMIVLRRVDSNTYVLVQKRLNTRERDWIGAWELPQGKIVDFNITQTALHELNSETGLELQGLIIQHDPRNYNGAIMSFRPFLIVSTREHLSFHFIAFATGEPHNTEEASDHKWVPLKYLDFFLKSERICPLNLPALEKLVRGIPSYIITEGSAMGIGSNSNHPVLAFDIGGILIKWNDEKLFNNIATLYKCTAFNIEDLLIKQKMRHNLHVGLISHKELHSKLNIAFGNIPYELFYDCWRNSTEIIYHNIDILFKLKWKYPDIKFVIASNIDAVSESILFDSCRLEKVFHILFSSWRMNLSKPNPLFFTNISKTMNSKKIFLVDDKKENLSAAANMGWSIYQQASNEPICINKITNDIDHWLLEGSL